MCLQSWTKYLEQDKKFSKIGRKQKTLITASAQLYYKRFISGRKTAGSISNQLLRFRSVKSFNNTLDNAVLCFFMLDIKYRFTSGE